MSERDIPEPGTLVKVVFQVDPPVGDIAGERMWVKVIKFDPQIGMLLGILDNQPVVRTDLKPGDVVVFDPDDVLEVDDA